MKEVFIFEFEDRKKCGEFAGVMIRGGVQKYELWSLSKDER